MLIPFSMCVGFRTGAILRTRPALGNHAAKAGTAEAGTT